MAQAGSLVERKIAHYDLPEPAEVGIESRRRCDCGLAGDSQQSGVVLRRHYYAVPDGFGMARDQLVLVEELVVLSALMHADGQPHVLDRDRITPPTDRDQGIVGHRPRPHQLVAIGK